MIVVSKTHLDLGFTDYAENIKKQYIDSFIPGAIELANCVNTAQKKNFVWTTGSWIIKEALEKGSQSQREQLKEAIIRGDIVPHALPFTTHTELLDSDTLDYGLSIVKRLDTLRGRKTTAAKMTDVPGHTKALVKALANNGIKLLHIGVNGASAIPQVPECFLWKSDDSEIVVIYSGDYGGSYKSSVIDEILYFDHTLDNHGAPQPKKILNKLEALQNEYPDYQIEAGCLDDFADIIWEHREKLPVIDAEIGDTWIHGSAADPYKSAALRQCMLLKNKWLNDGSMVKGSREYTTFTDNLLCVAEHTCGMDVKKHFADYEHYLKHDFNKARQKDDVKMRHIFADFPQNFLTYVNRRNGTYNNGSYSNIEKSWAEQRKYIDYAVQALLDEHKGEATAALMSLRPDACTPDTDKKFTPGTVFKCENWELSLNSCGGISALRCGGKNIIANNNKPVLEYRSYSYDDYQYWLNHYSRDLKNTSAWAIADFARPLLKKVRGKYPTGRFYYSAKSFFVIKNQADAIELGVNFTCDKTLTRELGAPKNMQIIYKLSKHGLTFDVFWYGKDANRLTEAIFLHIFPESGDVTLQKIGKAIDPMSTVQNGSRNLHAVQNMRLTTHGESFRFINTHSPIVSIGMGKILEFDNRFEDISKDGITYVLYDNVWGTNFPLWYSENARFKFEITEESYYINNQALFLH